MSLPIHNTIQGYGLIAILLHWSVAMLVIGLFLLGEWMVDLDYYDPWSLKAPDLHRGLGVMTAGLLILRLGWRLGSAYPRTLGATWERYAAVWVHRLFYALIGAICVSGYLITTADGQPVAVFGWFNIPASLYGWPNQADIAGEIHAWLATAIIVLAVLHGLAALKHHLIDRDTTLRRMLWPATTEQDHTTQPHSE